jgi:hypothetical protein
MKYIIKIILISTCIVLDTFSGHRKYENSILRCVVLRPGSLVSEAKINLIAA